MNPQLDKNILLAYMYGELDEAERQKVESYLATYPEAKAELDELQNTRQLLSHLPNQEVKPPVFVWDALAKTKSKVSSKQQVFSIGFKRNLSVVAASLLLFFLLAYVTKLQVSYHQNELRISFGGSPKAIETKNESHLAQNQNLSKEEVNKLIINYLQQNNDSLNIQLAQLENRLKQQTLLVSQKPKVESSNPLDKRELKLLLEQIKQDNLQTMLKITELSAQQQQASVDKMFQNFARYYEQQRDSDLQFIGTTINNLQQNQESTIKRQVMTDQILARLVRNK